ncbi:NH(3)-dependent NAD(+) synthetase [Striga asiatica]|uniref:NH(3)-dependent NAD(+) synthetase n=1 Tax=Striga asiatica TaxID=4170 RepID=A0A5A7PQK0_STRAF|nr:NH(3)-dependent NAD(+) synthetase [Striga asiatica]
MRCETTDHVTDNCPLINGEVEAQANAIGSNNGAGLNYDPVGEITPTFDMEIRQGECMRRKTIGHPKFFKEYGVPAQEYRATPYSDCREIATKPNFVTSWSLLMRPIISNVTGDRKSERTWAKLKFEVIGIFVSKIENYGENQASSYMLSPLRSDESLPASPPKSSPNSPSASKSATTMP